MIHSPPNPYCSACRFGKGLRVQHRKGAMKRDGTRPTKEGELLTMDWIILKSDESKGIDGESVLLLLLDVGTDFLTAHPSVRRDTAAAYKGISRAYGSRCKVKLCHMDAAKELMAACDQHRIPYETSTPYVHEENGLIEAHNRIELFGGKTSFEQCGAPLCFWLMALEHFAFS